MNKIFLLKNTSNDFLKKIDESSEIYPLDYTSLEFLNKKKIPYEIIDHYLSDNERKELFLKCRNTWEKLSLKTNEELKLENINIFRIIDRNEILEYMMEVFSEAIMIRKLIQKKIPKEIIAPKNILELINNEDNIKFNELPSEISHELTFDYVNLRKKIGPFEINSKISRKKFNKLKNFINTFDKILIPNNHLNDKKIILLLEFDPEIYENFLHHIQQSGLTPLLVNFRKPAISSKNSLNIIKKTNSIIFSKNMLNINEKSFFKEIGRKRIALENYIQNHLSFSEFDFFGVNLSNIIKNLIIKIINERIEEYFFQIECCKFLEKNDNVIAGLTLNLSGETEVIFNEYRKNIKIILMQHGFSNYHTFNQYTDTLDDYDLIKDKIAVWGNPVKDYLINNNICTNENVIVSGSPRHENFHLKPQKQSKKKIITVVPRPIIKHVEGTKIELQLKYKSVFKKLLHTFEERDDLKIIIKLHPQQNLHNEIIKSNIKEIDPKIEIFQNESIFEILQNTDFLINISPDNFDASTVIFESMLQKLPIFNIKLQKNSWIYDFEKIGAVKSYDYENDFGKQILELIDNPEKQIKQIQNIENFLKFYSVDSNLNYKILLNSITKL